MLLKAKQLDPTKAKEVDDNIKGIWAEIQLTAQLF
jgi:hypothetical protein